MTHIKVSELSGFYDSYAVFKNISFSVDSGEYLCILGENGSGKTTLMRCILELGVKYNGKIEYNGFTKHDIGWLPQRTEAQRDFPASVSEVVMSGFGGKSFLGFFYTKNQKEIAQKNMELMEISSLKNRSFKELSGGQQQKVLLCRALCAAQRVLLLDEPVTGLDAASRNEMYTLIKKLNKSGITVIMISHDVERALLEADKILHIGENDYFFGTPEEYTDTKYYKMLWLRGE